MFFKRIALIVLVSFSTTVFSQERELSPLSKISLLTVGIADELHSKFGHTAIRIQDPTDSMDIVFGYGGFDFDDPLFYSKFTTGKLEYSMTGHRYNHFLEGYKIENRWVQEQQLNFTVDQRNALFRFLINNYKEENRYYKYDFLFDNCATKVPEVFQEVFGNAIEFNFDHIKRPSTFRQLIHETLQTNAWTTFGIDLALGSVIDKKATPWEHQFLPLYVKDQFENSEINGEQLVTKNVLVLPNEPVATKTLFLLTPLFWLLLLLGLVLTVTYFDFKKKQRTRWLDFVLFFATGIAGLLICFLWFGTNHSATKVNFNMLWAFPLNIILAFIFSKKKKTPTWTVSYLWILIGLQIITGVLWLVKIQIFSPLIILILLALTLRYFFLISYMNSSKSVVT